MGFVQPNAYTGDEAEVFAAYENTGATPEQVQEWAKAAREERLVMLPCKIGDMLYHWQIIVDGVPTITKSKVNEIKISVRKNIISIFADEGCGVFSPDSFGKTVFRTREEAEAALDAQKGADPHA